MTKKKSTLGQWSDAYAAPLSPAAQPDASADVPVVPGSGRKRETYYLATDVIEAVRDASVHLGLPKGEIVETALQEWLQAQKIPPRVRRVRRGRPVE